jgi:ferrous iron transport protein A
MPVVTLDQLAPGESGRVVRVHGRGAVRRRLVDMGLTSGSVIDVIKLSPLGDPVEYRLRDYHLTLRASEARTIEVELLGGAVMPPTGREHSRAVKALLRCRSGCQVEIVRTRGGWRMSQHLKRLGMTPGSVFSLIRNDYPGPLILAAPSGERVVVGKGLARHIQVKEI